MTDVKYVQLPARRESRCIGRKFENIRVAARYETRRLGWRLPFSRSRANFIRNEKLYSVVSFKHERLVFFSIKFEERYDILVKFLI